MDTSEIAKLHLTVKEARVKYVPEIEAIGRAVNELGGDATVEEIVALMLTRGWHPPTGSHR